MTHSAVHGDSFKPPKPQRIGQRDGLPPIRHAPAKRMSVWLSQDNKCIDCDQPIAGGDPLRVRCRACIREQASD